MSLIHSRSLALGLLLAATLAGAQDALTETIVDAETRQPIPDVIVTATSPSRP